MLVMKGKLENMKKWCNFILTLILLCSLMVIGYEEQIKKDSTSQMDVNPSEKGMPQIVDFLVEANGYVALCEDGTVWRWDLDNNVDEAEKIPNLERVIKIVDAGSAVYALTQEGYVYGWGSNKGLLIDYAGNKATEYKEPFKINAISKIVELDAKNGKAFAVDAEGNFYMWGLYIYWSEKKDKYPNLPHNAKEHVNHVKSVFAGAGNYHYFVRDDGSVFSIMEDDRFEDYIYDFIFPQASFGKNDCDRLTLDDVAHIDISEGTKYGFTILYELENINNVELIGSDSYTVFFYGKGQSLRYWDSNTIKFHDNKNVMEEPTEPVNYSGKFVEVDMRSILGMEENEEPPKIIEICSGKENVLFLTDSGELFVSEYVTSEIRDVVYYDLSHTNPYRDHIRTMEDMPLKTLSFRKIDLEGIVNINTDGENKFYAVNHNGEYVVLDMQ